MGPKVRKSTRISTQASKTGEEGSEENEETTVESAEGKDGEVATDSVTNGVADLENPIEENSANNAEEQNGENSNTADPVSEVVSGSEAAPVSQESEGDSKNGSGDSKNGSGDSKNESGDSKNESGDSKNESGDSKNESGDSKNESGDSKNESGDSKNESGDSRGPINDDVPELEDATPQHVVPVLPKTKTLSVKLRTVAKKNDDDDFIEEVPVEKPEVNVVEILDDDEKPDEHDMTVIDEVTEADDDDKSAKIKVEIQVIEDEEKNPPEEEKEEQKKIDLTESIDPDTEMVSEDELPAENSKEPLETEAVSDEELPTASADLPETEAVSEDELPPESSEKKKKLKETTDEDKGKEVEKAEATSTTENNKGVKRKLSDDTNSLASDAAGKKEETPAKKIATDKSTTKQPVKSTKLPELDKYWKAVKDDSSDFTGWTYLLQYVDQENDIEAAREAYDAFLSHYPYCYGYWRKYADYEKRKGNKKKSEEVFERGLKAIPLSVDLWIHYLNYCKSTYPLEEDFIRSQFQKALDACGLEFRSDRLWESFIKWEAEGKHFHNVTQLYDKLLTIPTQGYTSHFDNFMEHVSNNQPSKVLSVDEFLTLRREILQLLKQYDTPISTISSSEGPPGDDDAPPGEEPPEAAAKKADEETTALRERIISIRRKVHKNTVVAVAARFPFEEGIKRPYFHVKPLERCQLKNWKDYLDYEIEQGDKDRIITLFERCLIACALYEDFWIRYLRYLEEKAPELKERISDVYERACTIHHKKKPHLHLYWSVWEESQGNIPKAREILANLDKNIPGSMQVAFRRINLERRAGKFEECANLYEHYIAASKSRLITNNLTIKYARFCWKSLDNVDKSISILKKAIEKDLENPRLYLQLIDMAMQRSPVVESEVVQVIDQFIALESSDMEQTLMFAQRKVEFLEDFGTDIRSMQKASEEFRRYLKIVKERKKKLSEMDSKLTKTDDVPSKKGKASSSDSSTALSGGQSTPAPSSAPASAGGGTHTSYNQGGYNQPPPSFGPGGNQGGYGPSVQQPYGQPPYGPPYNQSDPNYSYQNWNYSQPNYNNYNNQGWGSYNYYGN